MPGALTVENVFIAKTIIKKHIDGAKKKGFNIPGIRIATTILSGLEIWSIGLS